MNISDDQVNAANAQSATYVTDAYARAREAQAASEKKSATLQAIADLETTLTPYVKYIALGGVALIFVIMIINAGKKS